MTVQDMDIPYPCQHTLSGNHRPASEMPFKMFSMLHSKKGRKEGGRGGGGVGDRLESPVETHSIFVVFFFACLVVVVFYGLEGGVICCYSLFH